MLTATQKALVRRAAVVLLTAGATVAGSALATEAPVIYAALCRGAR